MKSNHNSSLSLKWSYKRPCCAPSWARFIAAWWCRKGKKRHHYTMNGIMLIIASITHIFFEVHQRKRNNLSQQVQKQNTCQWIQYSMWNYTCIIRMSKRPTNTVTDTKRSKAVLNRSADVLKHVASTKWEQEFQKSLSTHLHYQPIKQEKKRRWKHIPRVPRDHVQKIRLHLFLLWLLILFHWQGVSKSPPVRQKTMSLEEKLDIIVALPKTVNATHSCNGTIILKNRNV